MWHPSVCQMLGVEEADSDELLVYVGDCHPLPEVLSDDIARRYQLFEIMLTKQGPVRRDNSIEKLSAFKEKSCIHKLQ